MLKKIESIRKRPIEVRNRYAFWSALGFTTVIALFWLMSIPSRLDTLTAGPHEEIKIQGGISRSFADLRASISNGVETFNQIKEESSVPEAVPVQNDSVLNFDTFFSTSSSKNEVTPTKSKQVLIGTTSRATPGSTRE